MCSGTAKQVLFDRFSASGKDALILLIASDLDPSGETIANDVLHYLVRDCGMGEEQLTARKPAEESRLSRCIVRVPKRFSSFSPAKAPTTRPSACRFVAKSRHHHQRANPQAWLPRRGRSFPACAAGRRGSPVRQRA